MKTMFVFLKELLEIKKSQLQNLKRELRIYRLPHNQKAAINDKLKRTEIDIQELKKLVGLEFE
jgi:hypothetical protein